MEDSKEKLFDLVYSCRKQSVDGEDMLLSWEECGMVAEPCLDAGTNPDTFEVTYQVNIFVTVCIPHGCDRITSQATCAGYCTTAGTSRTILLSGA